MDHVVIEWRGPYQVEGPIAKDQCHVPASIVPSTTSGFIVHEDENYTVVASSIGNEGYRHVTAIPTVSIIRFLYGRSLQDCALEEGDAPWHPNADADDNVEVHPAGGDRTYTARHPTGGELYTGDGPAGVERA